MSSATQQLKFHAMNHGERQSAVLAVTSSGAEPLSPARQRQWIATLLLVGVIARVVRYALCFPLWEDECFLSANYLEGGYLDMLRPLNYHTVCPLLFSWVQLSVIKALGFSEYSLRLFPFACNLASLILFWRLASRLLRGTTLVLAVALFAASYPVMRYAAEAKPYACDLMVSLMLISLVVRWLQQTEETRWLWALAAFAPLAVGLSYPAVFVGGGLSLVAAARLCKNSSRGGWIAWAAYDLSLAGSFFLLFLVSIQPKLDAQLSTMSTYWLDAFPPISEPLKLLPWLVEVHSGSMLAYPIGGPNYGSALTLLCCLLGGAVFWRRRQFMPIGMTLAPLALNFAAAAMRRYPYGEHMRMTLYMAPMFCMLAAAGFAALLTWLARRRPARKGPLLAMLGLLTLVAASSIVRDFWSPYKSGNDLRARSFARWFWFSMSHNGEVVCLHSDLKIDPAPETFQHGCSASYLCNQRIYSPRHIRGEPPDWERISADWPLRCVQFRSPSIQDGKEATAAWLAKMESQYELLGKETYPFPFYDKRDRELKFTDYIDVYKFVPRAGGAERTARKQAYIPSTY
jgi:hypothetical protein